MTSSLRTGSVRSNGSMVSRSLVKVCSVPSTLSGPTRRRIASKACGQSSSAPSSSPIRCDVMALPSRASAEAGQVVGDLALPPRPVVGGVVAPDVEVVGDAAFGEQGAHPFGLGQRGGRVGLPGALADGEDDVQPLAQPGEVVAVQLGDVVGGVGEVRRLAALAPGVPLRGVVVAGLADGDREEVGAGQGELQGVVGAERAPGDDRVAGAGGVLADEAGDGVGDPGGVRRRGSGPAARAGSSCPTS